MIYDVSSFFTGPCGVLTTCWRISEAAQLLRVQSSQQGQGRYSLWRQVEAPGSFQKSGGKVKHPVGQIMPNKNFNKDEYLTDGGQRQFLMNANVAPSLLDV